MKPSFGENFPCGQKLVMSQSQRLQRDERDTMFYQNMRHYYFKTDFLNYMYGSIKQHGKNQNAKQNLI